MELKELVKKNRSYRGFDPSTRISMEELRDLIDTVRFTPSTINMQPLRFYLSNEEPDNEKFLNRIHFARKLQNLTLPFPGTEPVAYILISFDTRVGNPQAFLRDVGIAAQTIALGAVEKGYGCCMFGSCDKEGLKEVLNLPDYIEPNLVLAFGKPAETVVLTDWQEGQSTDYYRDENNIHYVPKKSLEDLLLN